MRYTKITLSFLQVDIIGAKSHCRAVFKEVQQPDFL